MIKNEKPLGLSESLEYIKEEGETEVVGFIKKFTELEAKEAKEIREKILELNLLKIKSEDIAKIIDILPEDKEDINKIFSDVALDEDETKKVLDVIKQYK